jgi:hypothetical protein
MTSGQDKQSSTDGGLKRAIIVSTTLLMAAVFGWLACIDRKENGDLDFRWHWGASLWIAIGLGCTFYFWRQVWPQNDSPDGKRKRLIKGWAAFLIPSLIWMTYPLRFFSGKHFTDVLAGLTAAAIVLTFGGWMLSRLIKGFNKNEPADKEKQ